MLTPKQLRVLIFIDDRINSFGVAPSYDEICLEFDLKSRSGIHRIVGVLEERGFITRLPGCARAITVVSLPAAIDAQRKRQDDEHSQEIARDQGRGNAQHTSKHNRIGSLQPHHRTRSDVRVEQIPMMGTIAAGTPIEAIAQSQSMINVPADMLTDGEVYALKVRGDSMIDAGILDGDTVLIRRTNYVDNGAIAVALIDQEEATLKRIRRRGSSIALEPANSNYATIIVPSEKLTIQGKMIGLLRFIG